MSVDGGKACQASPTCDRKVEVAVAYGGRTGSTFTAPTTISAQVPTTSRRLLYNCLEVAPFKPLHMAPLHLTSKEDGQFDWLASGRRIGPAAFRAASEVGPLLHLLSEKEAREVLCASQREPSEGMHGGRVFQPPSPLLF